MFFYWKGDCYNAQQIVSAEHEAHDYFDEASRQWGSRYPELVVCFANGNKLKIPEESIPAWEYALRSGDWESLGRYE